MNNNNLLLLHGALGTEAQFASLKDKLSADFKVFDLNFEGHGNRFSEKDFSIDLFAENVVAFMKEQGIDKTVIFGYSMGGYVALKLALRKPELVSKIITLGTKFNWSKEVAALEVKMLNPEKVEEKVPAFASRLEEIHSANDWKEVMRKTAKMMLDLSEGAKLTDEDLKVVGQDVLIGIGELDKMVTLEESENAASTLPNGKLKVIKGFKHPIEKVDMNQLTDIIVEFIRL